MSAYGNLGTSGQNIIFEQLYKGLLGSSSGKIGSSLDQEISGTSRFNIFGNQIFTQEIPTNEPNDLSSPTNVILNDGSVVGQKQTSLTYPYIAKYTDLLLSSSELTPGRAYWFIGANSNYSTTKAAQITNNLLNRGIPNNYAPNIYQQSLSVTVGNNSGKHGFGSAGYPWLYNPNSGVLTILPNGNQPALAGNTNETLRFTFWRYEGNVGLSNISGISSGSGATGPTGQRGSDGVTGPTGQRGSDGVTGHTGQRGFTGDRGPTGERGFTGDRGPTGQRGSDGVTGPTGQRGSDGVTGATGQRGFTGDRGATGERGFTGDRGPTGERGFTGDRGPTGQRGSDGVTGHTGQRGFTGDRGPTGERGFTGDRGPTGERGITGDRGPTGQRGSDGVTGATGQRGFTGDRGPTGERGFTGDRGPTGTFTGTLTTNINQSGAGVIDQTGTGTNKLKSTEIINGSNIKVTGGKISVIQTSHQASFTNADNNNDGILLSSNGNITEIKMNNSGLSHYSIQNDNNLKIINSSDNFNPFTTGTTLVDITKQGKITVKDLEISGGTLTIANNSNFNIIPAGMIMAGVMTIAPTGWLLCNGALVSKTNYSILFSVIGNTFDPSMSPTSTTFKLPDYRGAFLRCAGTSTLSADFTCNLNQQQTDAFKSHNHEISYVRRFRAGDRVRTVSEIGDEADGSNGGQTVITTTRNAGSSNETRPYNWGVNYFIKF